MRTVKIPALSNLEGAMTEVEFNRLLDAVRTAIEPALRKELLTHRRKRNQRAKGRMVIRAAAAPINTFAVYHDRTI
jgi:hypothetical protein